MQESSNFKIPLSGQVTRPIHSNGHRPPLQPPAVSHVRCFTFILSNLPRFLILLLSLATATSALAQGVREHTDPTRARYRLGNNTKAAGASVNESQASDVTLTLNPVTVRPIQTW